MFLRCSYFLAKSEADVLINSVLIKRRACIISGLTMNFSHLGVRALDMLARSMTRFLS